jgi:uncharacterized phage-associated protein
MKSIRFKFDEAKAETAITYLAKKFEAKGEMEKSTYYPILKILYFAEMEHLKKYGLPLIGDRYIAMKQGPVPSLAYDLIKAVKGRPNTSRLFKVLETKVTALQNPDMDELSEADIECLDGAFEKHWDKRLHGVSRTKTYSDTPIDSEIALEPLFKELGIGEEGVKYIAEYAEDQRLFA